jgi:hypothetical protein
LIELFQAQRLCQGYIQVYLGQRLLPRSGTFFLKISLKKKRQTSQKCATAAAYSLSRTV